MNFVVLTLKSLHRQAKTLSHNKVIVNDISPVLNKVRACSLCTNLPLGPNPIFQLNPKAKVLIAGQAPGRKTHYKGIPFDDPSGDRLRDWMGIDRDTFYNEAVEKQIFTTLPPNNKFSTIPQDLTAFIQCRRREIHNFFDLFNCSVFCKVALKQNNTTTTC